MSFLDKINAAKNPAAAAEKKVNPLLKKPAPVVTATAPADAPAETAAPIVAAEPVTTIAPKLNPFAKAAAAKAVADTSVQKAAETPAAPKKTLAFPFKKTATPVVEPAPAVAQEPVVETPPPAEEVAPPTEADVAPVETAKSETPVPEKKTTRRTSKSKKTEKDDSETAIDDTFEGSAEMPATTMSFSEVAAVLTAPLTDEAWEQFKTEIESEVSSIVVDQEMNPGVLKVVTSELNLVYDKIAQPLHETKTLLDNLTNKEDGTIAVIKNISLGNGNNDMERKKAGFCAAMNFTKYGGNINLFEAVAEVRGRYNFLKSVQDRLDYKNKSLIIMSAALKLERDFVGRGE